LELTEVGCTLDAFEHAHRPAPEAFLDGGALATVRLGLFRAVAGTKAPLLANHFETLRA
jgi:hypothetical protein